MENTLQNLAWAKHKLEIIFAANQRSGKGYPSLSRLFKELRNSPLFSRIADYPLLSSIVRFCRERGIRVEMTKIKQALTYSHDYQDLENGHLKREYHWCLLKS